MSKLLQLRKDLAQVIIGANIGFTEDNVIFKRQTDVWNDVATAISASSNGVALHIGVVEGSNSGDDSLEIDITVPLTIICPPEPSGETPEEDIWESLVSVVHDLRLNTEHYGYRFRFQSFSDIELQGEMAGSYLGRQTIFKRRLSL